MRRRILLAMGAAGSVAALVGTGIAASAATSGTKLATRISSRDGYDPSSLRALAAKIGCDVRIAGRTSRDRRLRADQPYGTNTLSFGVQSGGVQRQ
jgi:hypothetical protein